MFSGRCFAFGCSFTKWFYPTWANFIGYNYDEFYNFAQGGTSNSTHFQRLIEVDVLYKFTKDDTILWGLSGLGRHNFLIENDDHETLFFGCGSLAKDDGFFDNHHKYKPHSHIMKFVRDYYWKEKWGIYYTWLAVHNVKRFCDALGCNLYIIAGLDLDIWENAANIITNEQEQKMLADIKKTLYTQESLETFEKLNYKKLFPIVDAHPFIDANWGYVNKYFPQFITPINTKIYNDMYANFTEGVRNGKFTNENQAYDYLTTLRNEKNGWKEEQKLYGRYI